MLRGGGAGGAFLALTLDLVYRRCLVLKFLSLSLWMPVKKYFLKIFQETKILPHPLDNRSNHGRHQRTECGRNAKPEDVV